MKSDRDSTKEPPKEKEREKPPTIILKTREQSAPKEERPLSPNVQPSESEGPQPSKIAQNENKEKKTIGKSYYINNSMTPLISQLLYFPLIIISDKCVVST